MAHAVRLTEAAVTRFPAAPKGQRVDRPDTLAPGLFLRINDKGRKSWMVHFRINGGQGKYAIGSWPSIKVDEAREKARWAREQAKTGVHPRIAKASEEADKRRDAGELFGSIADQYIDAAKTGKLLGARKYPVTEGTAKGRESRLRRLILPALKNRPINKISTFEVSEFLSRIEARNGPVDRCLQDIRLVFRFATSRGLFQGASPVLGLTNRQAPEKKSRALDGFELRALWQAAIEYGYPFGHATRLLILTGQRRDEIGEMRWSEIDENRRLLVIPQSRSKNRKGDHEVPLCEESWEIIEEVRKIQSELQIKSDFLFSQTGETPISGWSRARDRLNRYICVNILDLDDDEKEVLVFKGRISQEIKNQKNKISKKLKSVELEHWRFHDIRHTVVTHMRNGEENLEGETIFAIALDVIQQVVNHEITAGVTSVYDHGDAERRYRIRKREALDWWGRKVMSIAQDEDDQNNILWLSRQKQVAN